jgi:hypothetical protein
MPAPNFFDLTDLETLAEGLDGDPSTGGQGVAGSNPVVPTVRGSPLDLDESPGQRAFSCIGIDLHSVTER